MLTKIFNKLLAIIVQYINRDRESLIMSEQPRRPNGVIGPTGNPLTIENLPPPNTKRWVMSRKAEVVSAVRNGLIGLDDACERYRLSVEEFLNWERLVNAHGLRGLRVTRSQRYREVEPVDATPVPQAPPSTRP